MNDRTYNVLHVFSGIGGGALGFEQAQAEFRGVRGRFRTIAAIDVDPDACADLEYLTGGRATVMDLFTREDYAAFHGRPPPEGWREATPTDLLAAAGGRRPDVVFGSPPCKGFSGLLSSVRSESPKYRALNNLVTRWLFLVLEAWRDDPPGLLLLENVPRIAQRGRPLLDQVVSMLRAYGYACAETVHDCGELGGLGQTRRRFLLVARRVATVDALLYEPPPQRLRTIGDVIGPMPLPVGGVGGPMHQLPRLKWETWVRLALIRASRDWRDLEERWAPGRWALVPDGAIWRLVERGASAGGLSVADPRPGVEWHRSGLGVRTLDEPCGTVTGRACPSTGAFSVADPRPADGRWPTGKYRVTGFGEPAGTVIGSSSTGNGAFAVADPRCAGLGKGTHSNVYRCSRWDGPGQTVIGATRPGSGALCVADPRLGGGDKRNGVFGVQPWTEASVTVTGSVDVHAGTAAVADPRPHDEPGDPPLLLSDDGAWHRPLSTEELWRIQGFPALVRGAAPVLTGASTTRWRMGIGNAVPPPAACAIGQQMIRTLLVAEQGAFTLSEGGGIWVLDPDGVLRWHATSRARLSHAAEMVFSVC